MKKRILVMLLALAMVFAMAACGGEKTNDNPTTDNPSTANPEGPATGSTGGEVQELQDGREIIPGTVMNFRLPNDNDTMLPWTSARSAGCLIQVYDTLTMAYMGDWNDIRGMLAREWTVSDDGLTYVFQITDKADFTNKKLGSEPENDSSTMCLLSNSCTSSFFTSEVTIVFSFCAKPLSHTFFKVVYVVDFFQLSLLAHNSTSLPERIGSFSHIMLINL